MRFLGAEIKILKVGNMDENKGSVFTPESGITYGYMWRPVLFQRVWKGGRNLKTLKFVDVLTS